MSHPDHPRERRRDDRHPLVRVLRFFCSRQGAATARALISVWSVVGIATAAGAGWVVTEFWSDWKAMKSSIIRAEMTQIGAAARHDAVSLDVGEIKVDMKEVRRDLNDHERRIYRMEGRP